MEGVDRLNELKDEMLVNNIMSRLDSTTKEAIRTTATISKRWKNLWTQLPHLIFSDEDDDVGPYVDSWIRYAVSRNVEDVDLQLFDVGVEKPFSLDDELLFKNFCFIRLKLSLCSLNPPNGAISWERLKCLCLSSVTLDEDMIEKILSGSPCLESLELDNCYGHRQIDITSKSVKKLVFSSYFSRVLSAVDYIDCIKINAPYIPSLTIKDALFLRELVLLNVSSLVEAHLDYSINWRQHVMFDEEVFEGLLESLSHVEDITFGDHCSELRSRLIARGDTSNGDQAENGDKLLIA